MGRREYRQTVDFGNGCYYQGEWRPGTNLRLGRGVYVWPDGQVYEGFWEDNHAQYRGRFVMPSGGVYEGELKNSQRSGMGKESWADGACYEGQFENGE